MYLLDTNTVSYLARKNPQVMNNFFANRQNPQYISVITEAEVLFGLQKYPERTQINNMVANILSKLTVLQWTLITANTYAKLKTHMQKVGVSLSDMDLLIACHALEHNLILVTSDKAFQQVPFLQVVDWNS